MKRNFFALYIHIVALTVFCNSAIAQEESLGVASQVFSCFYECKAGPIVQGIPTWQEVTTLMLANQSGRMIDADLVFVDGNQRVIARTSTQLSPEDLDEVHVCRTLEAGGVPVAAAGLIEVILLVPQTTDPDVGVYGWVKNLLGKFFVTVDEPFDELSRVASMAKTECRLAPPSVTTRDAIEAKIDEQEAQMGPVPVISPILIEGTGEVGDGIEFDLDVNADDDLSDPVDGVKNYIPGEEGGTKKLIADPNKKAFNETDFKAQKMKLIVVTVPNVVTSVVFKIDSVSTHPGYTGNKTDTTIEGASKDDDFSFKELADDREETGTIADGKATVDFFGKDYGGKAIVKAELKKDNKVVGTLILSVPMDEEIDGIADKWEKERVTEWNSQFGASETVDENFFSAANDKEFKDPDGASNGDSGTNLPVHKIAGDSLTVLQEYRGFILDGGGFDQNGANGHAGGHKRLSPAFKELLLEVDVMKDIVNNPTGGIPGVLGSSSKGFADKTNGAGIRMYWVIDEGTLAKTTFATDAALRNFLKAHRNATLKAEFLHLLFAADSPVAVSRQGAITTDVSADKDKNGSTVFIDRTKTFATTIGFPFNGAVLNAIVHELTHLLLIEPQTVAGQTKWDQAEHVLDPDEDGVSGNAGDQPFIMFKASTLQNNTSIRYSNVTRKELNVTAKQGTNP